jgi:hypothetical protein
MRKNRFAKEKTMVPIEIPSLISFLAIGIVFFEFGVHFLTAQPCQCHHRGVNPIPQIHHRFAERKLLFGIKGLANP